MIQIEVVAKIAGYISTILTMCLLFIRPLREWLFGITALKEGHKCLLRSEMLHIYYEYRGSKQIRQFELENFNYLYSAYKALNGNSFIDKIYADVNRWEVIT